MICQSLPAILLYQIIPMISLVTFNKTLNPFDSFFLYKILVIEIYLIWIWIMMILKNNHYLYFPVVSWRTVSFIIYFIIIVTLKHQIIKAMDIRKSLSSFISLYLSIFIFKTYHKYMVLHASFGYVESYQITA